MERIASLTIAAAPARPAAPEPQANQRVSGVSFSSNRRFSSALALTDEPAACHFMFSAAPLWQPGEWSAAELLFSQRHPADRRSNELRRAGSEFWYSTAPGVALKVSAQGISGYHPFPHNPLPLEFEFMEMGLALYLGLHGIPVFHGAAVEIAGAAILLVAESGSGKSSLTAALLQRGCGFLSDDVAALHGGERLIWPGHPYMRLHPDSAAALLQPGQYRPLYPARPQAKQISDVRGWARMHAAPCLLRAIYLLDARADHTAGGIAPLTGGAAVRTLAESQLGADIRPAPLRLKFLTDLIGTTPLRRISYRRSYAALDQAAALLMADVQASVGQG